MFGSAPAHWDLERGAGGGIHLHGVSVLPPVAVGEYQDVKTVYALRRLLGYLRKPRDARLCKASRLTPYSPDSDTRRRAWFLAQAEEAEARKERLRDGKTRLPPASGWTGSRTLSGQFHPILQMVLGLGLKALAIVAYALSKLGAPCPPETSPVCISAAPSWPAQRQREKWHEPPRIGQGLAF